MQLWPRPHRGRTPAGTLRSETADFEAYSNEFIEATLVKALFPQDEVRRRFLRAVGKGTAMAAISSLLPVGSHASHGAREKGLA
jgi:nitrate/nitrite transport system substrate-binding protein